MSRSVRDSSCEVEVAEQLADRLRAHAAAEVDAEAVRRAEAVLELAEQLLVVDDLLDVELAEELPRLLEPADALDRRLARVLAAALDVGDHLLDLRRPLLDGLEVLLAGTLDEAEVVRELAHLLGAGVAPRRARARRAGGRCRSRAPARGSSRRRTRRARRRRRTARRPTSSWSSSLWRCFVIAPFFAPDAFSSSARSGSSAARISTAAVATDSISRGASRRSSRVAVCRTSSRSRFGSSLATVFARSGKIAAGERPRLLEAGQHLVLGPVREAAGPELVVLVEAACPCRPRGSARRRARRSSSAASCSSRST